MFRPTHTSEAAKELLALHKERTDPVAVAGRIMVKRLHGGSAFADLQDAAGRLQLFASREIVGPEGFDAFADLDPGDIVGARGPMFYTRRGEPSVEVHSFELLTKAMRPLPDKWHGLKDVEIRYRQRYVDLIANEPVRDVFRKRTHIISAIRRPLRRARIPRGRDAGAAGDTRWRPCAAVPDASQRARP